MPFGWGKKKKEPEPQNGEEGEPPAIQRSLTMREKMALKKEQMKKKKDELAEEARRRKEEASDKYNKAKQEKIDAYKKKKSLVKAKVTARIDLWKSICCSHLLDTYNDIVRQAKEREELLKDLLYSFDQNPAYYRYDLEDPKEVVDYYHNPYDQICVTVCQASYDYFDGLGQKIEYIEDEHGNLWRLMKTFADEDQVAYECRENKVIIIGYRGTVPTSSRDLAADFHIVMGSQLNKTDRFHHGEMYFQRFKRLSKYNNHMFIVTGHSLGGAQALHVGVKHSVLTILFNPAVGMDEMYLKKMKKSAEGEKDLSAVGLKEACGETFAHKAEVKEDPKLKVEGMKKKLYTYKIKGDPVSYLSGGYGTSYEYTMARHKLYKIPKYKDYKINPATHLLDNFTMCKYLTPLDMHSHEHKLK